MRLVSFFSNYRFKFFAVTFYFLFGFSLANTSFSQNVVVYLVNGESEATAVEEIDKITIQGAWLKFHLVNSEMINYHLGSVIRYEFDFTSGITDQPADNLSDLLLFPNPAVQSVTVSFSLIEATDVELQLLDLQGRQINVKQAGILPTGKHQLEISNPQSAAGYYLLQVTTASGTQVKPVLFTTTK